MVRLQTKLPEFLLSLLKNKAKAMDMTQSELIEKEILKLYENSKELVNIAKLNNQNKTHSSFYLDASTIEKIKELEEHNIFNSHSDLFSEALKNLLISSVEKKSINNKTKETQEISLADNIFSPAISDISEKEPFTLSYLIETYDDLSEFLTKLQARFRALLKEALNISSVANPQINSILNNTEHINKDQFIQFHNYNKIIKNQKKNLKLTLLDLIKDNPIYRVFLSNIRGIGSIISAKMIQYFGDCSQYETVSKLWAHTGNHVVNGRAPKKTRGVKIHYDPELSSFTYQISLNLMRQNKGFYRTTYAEEKKKQQQKTYNQGYLAKKYNGYQKEDTKLSKLHIHRRALRKVRKIFLDHYWHVAREVNGLEAKKNYVEGVLEHQHIISYNEALKLEGSLK